MAISPLALGIGLQGKYDYRQQAALEMSRAKGRAKAEADEEAARAKKLAPIERRLINMRGAPLLPVHQKEVTRKVTEALDYMMEHPEDLSGVTQRLYDIESSTQAYKGQYDSYKKSQFGKNVKGNAESIRVLGISDNADDINDAFAGIAGSTIKFDPQSKNVTFEPIDYLPTSTHIDKAFQAGGSKYYDPTGKETVLNIGEKKYTTLGINPAVPEMIKQDVLGQRDKSIALTNDYSQYLESNNQPLPNLRTAEGKQEFQDGMVKFLDESIARDFANRGLLLNVTPSKGISFTYNAPGVEKALTINPASGGDIILKYAKYSDIPFAATPLGKTATGNYNALLANTTRTFDIRTGDQIDVAQVKDTDFNEMGVFYVLKKDYKDLKAGLIVPNAYINEAIKLGVVEPQILALGLQKGDTGKSVYFPVSNVALSQIMDTTPKDRKSIETLQNSLEQKRKEVAAKLPQKEKPINKNIEQKGGAPAAKPSGRMRWDAKKNKMVPY
jgi:hypothetical protein